MLHEHLKVKTRPLAKKENVVFFRDYRVTVLSSRLFRIEKSKSKKFTDEATQAVYYRDVSPVRFTAKEEGGALQIKTDALTLSLCPEYDKSYVVFLDKPEEKIPLTNAGNLGGTYRTLDVCDGGWHQKTHYDERLKKVIGKPEKKVDVGFGVCSKTGVAVYTDKDSLILKDDGLLAPRAPEEADDYVFCFQHDYAGAVKALYSITGFTPMLPRYALGNWWSRYHAYTEDEYLALLDSFHKHDVPLTVATVDMDWHYSNDIRKELGITEHDEKTGTDKDPDYRLGWTGYTFNKNLFPDYRRFLNEIKKRNLKITMNLHPADGVRFFEAQYPAMCKAMGVDPKTKAKIPFAIANPDFINAYFDILHHPYEEDGVAFWWIDWQQGVKSELAGLDPLWALNHYHTLDNALLHDKPMILSRYAGVGSHRYPLGFSGDTFVSYDTLSYLPYFTATASNVGYSWWSHDIGGHMHGVKDGELFTRHVQYGVFSPVLRLHSTSTATFSKEPWVYTGGTGAVAENALRFRHRLIPFLYTENYRTHESGTTLISPLYYRHPENACAYRYENEYYFGDLLVAPVTTPRAKNGYAAVPVWLPQGKWTDIFTGETYDVEDENGVEITLYRTLESIPVLAKDGTTLVLSDDLHTNSVENPTALECRIYEGNGSYTLYEDKDDRKAFTAFTNSLEKKNGVCRQTVTVSVKGDGVFPAERNLKLVFVGRKPAEFTVKYSGAGDAFSFEAVNREQPELTLTGLTDGCRITVTATYKETTRPERRKKEILLNLLSMEGDAQAFSAFYSRYLVPFYTGDKQDFLKAARRYRIPKKYFRKLTETDF